MTIDNNKGVLLLPPVEGFDPQPRLFRTVGSTLCPKKIIKIESVPCNTCLVTRGT